MWGASLTFDVRPGPTSVIRLAGADRYKTAAAISAAIFPAHPSVMFVATGARLSGCPCCRSSRGEGGEPCPARCPRRVARCNPGRVAAPAAQVRLRVGRIRRRGRLGPYGYREPGDRCLRIAGADRYLTASHLSSLEFAPGVPAVFIATGTTFPDALGSVPAAKRMLAPLLLVPPSGIPIDVRNELTRLQPAQIIVVGGSAVVPDSTVAAFECLHDRDGQTTCRSQPVRHRPCDLARIFRLRNDWICRNGSELSRRAGRRSGGCSYRRPDPPRSWDCSAHGGCRRDPPDRDAASVRSRWLRISQRLGRRRDRRAASLSGRRPWAAPPGPLRDPLRSERLRG